MKLPKINYDNLSELSRPKGGRKGAHWVAVLSISPMLAYDPQGPMPKTDQFRAKTKGLAKRMAEALVKKYLRENNLPPFFEDGSPSLFVTCALGLGPRHPEMRIGAQVRHKKVARDS